MRRGEADVTTSQAIVAFVAAASVLTVTPGLDTALVLRSATVGGRRHGAYAAVGIALGCLVWGGAVSVGLGALLAGSKLAYGILKLAGAAYLLWVGVKLILRPRKDFDDPETDTDQLDARHSLRQGLLTNLLNPKVGVFYITFLPQFVPAGTSVVAFSLLLTGIHVLLGLFWFAALIAATIPVGQLLRRRTFVATMDRLTGAVFIVFGTKLAWAE